MAELFVLFLSLTIFGAGVTLIDFLGILDNIGNDSGNSGSNDSDSDDASAVIAKQGSNLVHEDKKTDEKPGIKILSRIMTVLRSAVYFTLGFGPTGLFASISGLSKTTGLLWALAAGATMMILARILKRLIRRDLDSSIKPDELLQEEGVLLLPLNGEGISKAAVRQYGRETEIYVRCRNKDMKLLKGTKIIIEEYDNDVYWIKPSE